MGSGALDEPGRDVWHVGNFSIRYPAAVSVPAERGQARIEGIETAECVFEDRRVVPNLLLRQEGGLPALCLFPPTFFARRSRTRSTRISNIVPAAMGKE
jgi:hypothetical protein